MQLRQGNQSSRLYIKNGDVVKGVNFVELRDAVIRLEQAQAINDWGKGRRTGLLGHHAKR